MPFIPMLATDCGDLDRLAYFVENDGWALEQKIDGHRRAIATTGPDTYAALNRRGEPTDLPSVVRKAITPLPGGFVLDGELLGDVLYVFDLPGFGSLADPNAGLAERRDILERLFGLWEHGPAVQLLPMATTTAAKSELVERVVGLGGEGFMAKRLDGPYAQGRRSPVWQKVKLTSCADVIVTAVSPDGRENYEVAVWDNGELTPVGSIAWNHKRSGGPLDVGDVVEVRYLYVGAQQRLVQPRIIRRRTDKTPVECTADQLRPVNKEIVL